MVILESGDLLNKRNNQSKSHFSKLSDKPDENIIRNIQKYLIETRNWKPIIEPFLLFKDEKYMGCARNITIGQAMGHVVKHTDLFIQEKKLVIEIDGLVHRKYATKTEERNELYHKAGLSLIVLDLEEIRFFKKNVYKELESQILMQEIALL